MSAQMEINNAKGATTALNPIIQTITSLQETMQSHQHEIDSLRALNNSLQSKLNNMDTKLNTHLHQIFDFQSTTPTQLSTT